MATQAQIQGVQYDQPRHRHRAKERPDALENQFSKLAETYSYTQRNDTGSHTSISNAEPNSILQEVAQAFARMDKAICEYLAKACRTNEACREAGACDALDQENFNLQTLAESHGCSNTSDWLYKIESEVKASRSRCIKGFEDPEAYLTEFSTGMFWAEAEAVFSQTMARARSSNPQGNTMSEEQLVESLSTYSNKYCVLIANLLPELVELNRFDSDMQGVLRRKWIVIDSILDRWFKEKRTSRIPRWQELEMFKHRATNGEDHLPAQLNHISSTLWLSLLVFVITIPTTALGWRYLPHQPGTTQDADFWFLIQSSWITILGFAVLAIPIWRTKTFSAKARFWVWGLLITGSLCVALSPLVYLFEPTEWSQFMSIVSGIVQVFLTLQIALVADSAGQRGGKSGKKDK
ncbi:hypothetical protein JMJ35_000962 [Cladonia borealis]|uniref:Uncharacterized protein n=1 Tax=Cladonia borealis TaxID=184061 RepID=A0AA39V7H1_9LECA|nr:hypothetical protein JMJ35_000962 [Cladonia borealis]